MDHQIAPQRRCEIDNNMDWGSYDRDRESCDPTNHTRVGAKAELCGKVCHNPNE
jgi:hypothetical protein